MEKKVKAIKCLVLPKTSGLGMDKDSHCIYNPTVPTPIYN
jgi:hypothetical protein